MGGTRPIGRVIQGVQRQGKPGKPGIVREFCRSGNVRELSGNFEINVRCQGILK
jgi:hypothetical protein